MNNFFSTESTVVPNGYIYTSHTGAKYVFLEGLWFNDSNMMLVDPQKYPNMYISARQQIVEHNQSPYNEFKVGSTYIKENVECTYIGSQRFYSNKGIIAENIYISEEEPEPNISVPNGYQITSGKGKTYTKQNGNWFDNSTKKPLNSSAAKGVERAAEAAIKQHNASGGIKIGSKITSKSGKEYEYVGGDRFIAKDGKLVPKSAAQTILNKYNEQQSQEEPQNEPQEQQPEVQKQSKPQNEPQKPSSTEDGESGIESLASKISASPFAPKIKVLLTRGDKVSLLAADILLSGKRDEAVKILKSLNNNDE